MEPIFQIQEDRLLETFFRLVKIDTESYHEREMADTLTRELTKLGFAVEEDDAGDRIGGDAGNLHGFLAGELPGEPILFSGHMDTVRPGGGKKPVLLPDGRITSDGTTVLGSDDLCAAAGILEGVRTVLEMGVPHRDIEIVFSACEEFYCEGIKVFDFGKLRAKHAFVLDMSGFPGIAAVQAPTILSFEAEVIGKSAHAGFGPENGIHAIQIASEAIAKLPEGHLDDDTTLNVGYVMGGGQTNIVPERCLCRGEIRSFHHEKALQTAGEVRRVFAAAADARGAGNRFETTVHVQAYHTPEDSVCVKRFFHVCEELGLEGRTVKTFGGSDNNVFALHGIEGIVLSCGMNQVHSTQEFTSRKELCACAQMAAALCCCED